LSVKKMAESRGPPGTVDYRNPPMSQQVRDLLTRAGLSQDQGARELGVDERTMRYWCAGEHEPPRMAILALERLLEMRRTLNSLED